MSKQGKIITIVVVVLVGIAGVCVPLIWLNPFDVSQKTVTIDIVCQRLSIEETFTYTTYKNSLGKLLSDKQDQLDIVFETNQYGMFIKSVYGIDMLQNEFIAVYTSDIGFGNQFDEFNPPYTAQNGVTCYISLVGASQLPLVDGQVYAFIISTW